MVLCEAAHNWIVDNRTDLQLFLNAIVFRHAFLPIAIDEDFDYGFHRVRWDLTGVI